MKFEDYTFMMTDPIADMLTRIRNAVQIEKDTVEIPYSKEKQGLADALKREGYILDWEVLEAKPVSTLRVVLKYGPNGEKIVGSIERISRPGCRVYLSTAELKPVLNGLGIRVLNTNRGILSDREAKIKNVGGEVICQVY